MLKISTLALSGFLLLSSANRTFPKAHQIFINRPADVLRPGEAGQAHQLAKLRNLALREINISALHDVYYTSLRGKCKWDGMDQFRTKLKLDRHVRAMPRIGIALAAHPFALCRNPRILA
jgi:hypothetical protein